MFENKINLCTTATIPQEYLEQIKDQKKTVEGRIYEGIFRNLREGSKIKFIATNSSNKSVLCKILSTKRYNNFREMLQVEGFRNCFPTACSLERAVNIYNGIPKYSHQVPIYGAVAIRIQVIE